MSGKPSPLTASAARNDALQAEIKKLLPENAPIFGPDDITDRSEKFLAADVGITGANFLSAAEGAAIIVTNEGNGDLTQTLPKIHIVLASLEKGLVNHPLIDSDDPLVQAVEKASAMSPLPCP